MPSAMPIIGLLDLRASLTCFTKPRPLLKWVYFPFFRLQNNEQKNLKMRQEEGNWQTHPSEGN